MRLAKSRITNYGPPKPTTGLDALERIQQRDAAAHDKAIADYEGDLLVAAGEDLMGRRAWDFKNPEHRWVMGRRAAILRKLATI